MTVLSSTGGPGLGKRTYAFLRSIPTWVLWLLVILWTIPSLGLFVNSFRTRNAQRASGWWHFPFENYSENLTFDNYIDILSAGAQGGLWRALLNSLAIALPATVIPIAFAAFAAYAFAWIDFKGREWLFIATVSLLAIPAQMSLIPLLQLYSGGGHLTLPFLEKTLTLFPDLDLAVSRCSAWPNSPDRAAMRAVAGKFAPAPPSMVTAIR
jgi:alpha-glucoside transport system permease protein